MCVCLCVCVCLHIVFGVVLGAIDYKDFRPISLVSGVYKIIAKVLANRLKRSSRRLFRSLIMLLLEVGKSLILRLLLMNVWMVGSDMVSRGCSVCKLDIEKAYDHVNWNFFTC